MMLERIAFVTIGIILAGVLLWNGLDWRDSAKQTRYASMGSTTDSGGGTSTVGYIAIWERGQEGGDDRLWSLVLGLPPRSRGILVDVAGTKAMLEGQRIDTDFIDTPGVYLLNADLSLQRAPFNWSAMEIRLGPNSSEFRAFIHGPEISKFLSETKALGQNVSIEAEL